jgi:spore germination protein YaaH
LKGKLGTKMLSCTIEARTPPSSLYKNIPSDLEYVNDYKEINKYCDRVKLMTYDQQSADIVLNKAGDRLYSPVSDPLWVQKVVTLTLQDIDKSKLVIGVPTYGYIYKVTPWDDGTGYHYDLQEAFNPRYATELATQLDIKPARNRAGELSFTYVPDELSASSTPVTSSTGTTTIQLTQDQLASYAPKNTPSGLRAALGAKKLAETTGAQQSFYMLWWSDSKAIADKIALAKKLGVRGVAIFKLDGGEDQGIWSVLK